MWNKKAKEEGRAKKLSAEIFEYLIFSAIVSGFTYLFLYLTSQSISEVYLERHKIFLDGRTNIALGVWLKGVCIAAAVCIFVFLFLLLLGQRLSYLIRIIGVVEKMQNQDVQAPLEGDDELTQLAENINFFIAADKELKQKEKEMQEAREKFIRSLSHDIRTPLTSMLSYSELLEKREEISPEEMKKYVLLVKGKSLQVKELMDQLLDGRKKSREMVENITFLMQQYASEWEEILEERFTCRIHLEGCELHRGMVDLTSLGRMMDNLISNVEKYADPEKEVCLTIESRDDTLIILQSNGINRKNRGLTESRRIGLESIRALALQWNGTVDAGEEGDCFCIRIELPVLPVL